MKRIVLGNIPCRMIKLIFSEGTYFNPTNITIWGVSSLTFKKKMGKDMHDLIVKNTKQF